MWPFSNYKKRIEKFQEMVKKKIKEHERITAPYSALIRLLRLELASLTKERDYWQNEAKIWKDLFKKEIGQ